MSKKSVKHFTEDHVFCILGIYLVLLESFCVISGHSLRDGFNNLIQAFDHFSEVFKAVKFEDFKHAYALGMWIVLNRLLLAFLL